MQVLSVQKMWLETQEGLQIVANSVGHSSGFDCHLTQLGIAGNRASGEQLSLVSWSSAYLSGVILIIK